RPVLGICNGFQVLVRAGLLPDNTVDTLDNAGEQPFASTCSLTDNTSAQFECRWIRLSVQQSACIFTYGVKEYIELPVAHGEGRFVLTDPLVLKRLQLNGQIPLVYTELESTAIGRARYPGASVPYPANPNGSTGNIAGICNAQGNVFGLMPHPERYVNALQHPQRRGTAAGQGNGLLIFKNAYEYARKRERIVL
ncbi:MAG TPA: phosphoribosylformylglycinamidine synthase subunit PurQ, partial [Ktedonobacteraceae bacterium]|nr:phosphoribosylformylglycinamidine synthase subunit PurQ [Ktedonobacteraceae bacterium]